MKLLVLGGTTFVSRSVAEHFTHANYQVDIFTRGSKPVTYTGINHHIIGDRHDADLIQSLNAYDYIFDITAYTRDDVQTIVENIDTSQLKRYIFCSSGAVYKPNDQLIVETDPIGENHNWLKYGLDKLQAESYLLDHEIPVTIFRPTYIYGPHNVLYRETYFFDRLTKSKVVKYPKSTTQTQFIHIHDLCMILESFLTNDQSINQAYNVTHESVYDFSSMLEVYEQVTGMEMLKEIVDDETNVRSYFPYRDVTYKLAIDKLKAHGLHVPQFDLYEGLKQTYQWYLKEKPKLKDPYMTQIKE